METETKKNIIIIIMIIDLIILVCMYTGKKEIYKKRAKENMHACEKKHFEF